MSKGYSIKLLIMLLMLLFSSCSESSSTYLGLCEPNPCRNSNIPNKTVCTEEGSKYSCVCENGYELKPDGTCSRTNNNPCKNNPCTDENKGTCIVVGSFYECYCDTGFIEVDGRCELNIGTLCENFSCPINSKCEVVEEEAMCFCYAGYEKSNNECVLICEEGFVLNENKDECILDCSHIAGSLVNENNNLCICEQNFHIEEKVCVPNVKKVNCRLGNPQKPQQSSDIIEAVDIFWDYDKNSWEEASYCSWECLDNYHGEFCNQCDDEYLMSDGLCVFDCSSDIHSVVNASNDSCVCLDGYQLSQGSCREVIDPCEPNLCLEYENINKSTCVANSVFELDYSCECNEGYEEDEAGNCVELSLSEGCYLDIYSDIFTYNLKNEELIDELHAKTLGHHSLGYSAAKIKLFGYFDNFNNKVMGVYTGQFYSLRYGNMPNQNQFNCEHTWPQSKFGRAEPMRSDLHHLFPTYSTVNSSRGSLPFGYVDVIDNEYSCTYGSSPDCLLSNPDDYKSYRETNVKFEVADQHKGNTARAMFYFAVRYGSMDNISENFFADQKEELYQWSLSDPVDDFERNRNNEIYNLQQNRNPFVDCPELLDRIDIGNTTFPQYNERK